MALIPERDEQYLKDKQFRYDLTQMGPEIHLVVHGWPFPVAYNVRTADILIRIPAGYPLTPLDMFYTNPTVMLTTGAPPAACQQWETHGGQAWQRWSRHHAWRPGVDNLRTFITAMSVEIQKGI
jgi:hypothetical protein